MGINYRLRFLNFDTSRRELYNTFHTGTINCRINPLVSIYVMV